jgi:hypothetical protein
MLFLIIHRARIVQKLYLSSNAASMAQEACIAFNVEMPPITAWPEQEYLPLLQGATKKVQLFWGGSYRGNLR